MAGPSESTFCCSREVTARFPWSTSQAQPPPPPPLHLLHARSSATSIVRRFSTSSSATLVLCIQALPTNNFHFARSDKCVVLSRSQTRRIFDQAVAHRQPARLRLDSPRLPVPVVGNVVRDRRSYCRQPAFNSATHPFAVSALQPR